MGKTSSTKSALVVLNGSPLSLEKTALKKLQARTIDAVELIARSDRDNVQRRIIAGMALLVVKEQLAHGDFLPWLKKNVSGAGYTQCTYFMRAALCFLDGAVLGRADLLTLTAGAGTLTLAKKAQGTKLVGAVRHFCADLSWTELLEREKIRETKPLGGAREAGADEPAAPQDAEQLYLFSRDEIGGVITQAETLLLKENRLQHLAGHPEEIRGVVTSLRALADKVEAAANPLLKPATAAGK